MISRHKWSPATTGLPGPSTANCVAVDGSPGPTMAAMDGPLCCKSPGRKPAYGGNKSWLATPFNSNAINGRLLQ